MDEIKATPLLCVTTGTAAAPPSDELTEHEKTEERTWGPKVAAEIREQDKKKRFRFLVTLAQRLSGPLYGKLIDFGAAKRAIKEPAQ